MTDLNSAKEPDAICSFWPKNRRKQPPPCESWSPCSAWPYLLSTSMIIELLANWPDAFILGRHCSWASSRRLASVGWNSVLPSKVLRHNCQNRLAKLFAIPKNERLSLDLTYFEMKPIKVSPQSLRLLPAIHLHLAINLLLDNHWIFCCFYTKNHINLSEFTGSFK